MRLQIILVNFDSLKFIVFSLVIQLSTIET